MGSLASPRASWHCAAALPLEIKRAWLHQGASCVVASHQARAARQTSRWCRFAASRKRFPRVSLHVPSRSQPVLLAPARQHEQSRPTRAARQRASAGSPLLEVLRIHGYPRPWEVPLPIRRHSWTSRPRRFAAADVGVRRMAGSGRCSLSPSSLLLAPLPRPPCPPPPSSCWPSAG